MHVHTCTCADTMLVELAHPKLAQAHVRQDEWRQCKATGREREGSTRQEVVDVHGAVWVVVLVYVLLPLPPNKRGLCVTQGRTHTQPMPTHSPRHGTHLLAGTHAFTSTARAVGGGGGWVGNEGMRGGILVQGACQRRSPSHSNPRQHPPPTHPPTARYGVRIQACG